MPHLRKRLPLISLGILLILIAAAPIMIGMKRGFDLADRGEDSSEAIRQNLDLAFHPALRICSAVGMLLILVGIIRLALRKNRA